MARLEKDGVIAGYTLRLRSDVQTQQIKAWMSIAVEGNRTREAIANLMGEPGVTQNKIRRPPVHHLMVRLVHSTEPVDAEFADRCC
jgi:hypothetical protein